MAEYITKDQVIEWFRPYGHTEEGISFNVLKTDIAGMPAADVSPVVHGRWEETALVEVDDHGESYRIPNAGLRCPWCMCAFDKKLLWRRSYCPNCGARMDGEA